MARILYNTMSNWMKDHEETNDIRTVRKVTMMCEEIDHLSSTYLIRSIGRFSK